MLPYKTLQEAETPLGRTLTTAETLWFNYSGNKSDYLLYCHSILFVFLTFSIVPLFYLILDLIYKNFHTYKIQPNVKPSYSDIFRCYRDVMRIYMLVIGPLQLVSFPAIKMIGIRTGLPLPSVGEIVAQLTVYFIVEDYLNYWTHRFLHCKWGYEKIHRVHHEYTAPIGFTASYVHWADILITSFPMFLGPAMVPGHMITWWLWVGLRQLEAVDTHSMIFHGIPTKYIPFYGGADYHDYHHYVGGPSQSNFGIVFTYCDYIYGTNMGYRYQKRLLQRLKDGMKNSSKQNRGMHISTEDPKGN